MARGSTKNAANCASLCKMQITRTSTCRTHIAGPKPWRFGSRTSEGRYRLELNQYELGATLSLRRYESAASSASLRFARRLGLHGSSSRTRPRVAPRRLLKYGLRVYARVNLAPCTTHALSVKPLRLNFAGLVETSRAPSPRPRRLDPALVRFGCISLRRGPWAWFVARRVRPRCVAHTHTEHNIPR